MRSSTLPRLTPAVAEHLLDGGDRPAELHQLLAAAAGPGTARELAGEPAAVAAFVTAPLPSHPVRRPSMLSTAVSKILAAKALAAVVLLAGATGGVALAANSTGTTQTTQHATTTADGTNNARKSDDSAPIKPTNSKKPENARTLDPSLQGLCRAFTAGGLKADKDHLPPAFDALVAAAGSAANVEKFCAGQPVPGKSGDAPGQVAKTSEPAKPADSSDSDDGEKAKATKKPEVAATDAPMTSPRRRSGQSRRPTASRPCRSPGPDAPGRERPPERAPAPYPPRSRGSFAWVSSGLDNRKSPIDSGGEQPMVV
jgi:hypothetical protein